LQYPQSTPQVAEPPFAFDGSGEIRGCRFRVVDQAAARTTTTSYLQRAVLYLSLRNTARVISHGKTIETRVERIGVMCNLKEITRLRAALLLQNAPRNAEKKIHETNPIHKSISGCLTGGYAKKLPNGTPGNKPI
jgi:hypothetical protein